MTLVFDQKEDLRLKMADLEQKLEESEEERKKLEKTCNMLVRAFREEEKMQYKALNNKYEKFLEDCKVRRMRNDVILKSLCRVEERARALFARTERLKLLKDRYITYLKPDDLKKDQFSLSSKVTTFQLQKGFANKSVSFKLPSVDDFLSDQNYRKLPEAVKPEILKNKTPPDEFFSNCERIFQKRYSYDYLKEKYKLNTSGDSERDASSSSLQQFDNQKENVLNRILSKETLQVQDRMSFNNSNQTNTSNKLENDSFLKKFNNENVDNSEYSVKTSVENRNKELLNFVEQPNNIEQNSNAQINSESIYLQQLSALKERGFLKHQECIENLKTVLSKRDEAEKEKNDQKFSTNSQLEEEKNNQKIIEKEEFEMNEKSEQNSQNESVKADIKGQNSMPPHIKTSKLSSNIINNDVKKTIDFEEKNDVKEENINEGSTENDFSFPKGLDGVDYQNETYPESYYEQPVHHHNYSDIVTNVILEEDEYEQEVDAPEVSIEETKKFSVNPTTENFDQINLRDFPNEDNSRHSSSPSEVPEGRSSNISNESRSNGQFVKKSTSGSAEIGSSSPKGHDSGSSSRETSEKVKSHLSVSDKNSEKEKQTNPLETNKTKLNLNQKPKNVSNLIQLLESDSESFQIEHGDLVSGNDDSDFDFSFN